MIILSCLIIQTEGENIISQLLYHCLGMRSKWQLSDVVDNQPLIALFLHPKIIAHVSDHRESMPNPWKSLIGTNRKEAMFLILSLFDFTNSALKSGKNPKDRDKFPEFIAASSDSIFVVLTQWLRCFLVVRSCRFSILHVPEVFF